MIRTLLHLKGFKTAARATWPIESGGLTHFKLQPTGFPDKFQIKKRGKKGFKAKVQGSIKAGNLLID